MAAEYQLLGGERARTNGFAYNPSSGVLETWVIQYHKTVPAQKPVSYH